MVTMKAMELSSIGIVCVTPKGVPSGTMIVEFIVSRNGGSVVAREIHGLRHSEVRHLVPGWCEQGWMLDWSTQ